MLLLTFIDELREKGMEIKEAIKQAALIRLREVMFSLWRM